MELIHLLPVLLILCGNVPATSSAAPRVVPCVRPTEVVFLVDTSHFVDEDFLGQMAFIKSLLPYFNVSSTTTRMAAISYSKGAKVVFDLDTFSNTTGVQKGLGKVKFTKDQSLDSHTAIRLARKLLLHKSRKEASRNIVYFTNGKATEFDEALEEAREVRIKGILLFAVGVESKVDVEELGQLATEKNERFVFIAKAIKFLHRHKYLLAKHICSGTAPVIKPPAVRCNKPADIVFLVDTSRSMSYKDFSLELKFVQDMIRQFHVSRRTTRVAVVSYSSGFKEEISLDQFQSSGSTMKAVGSITFTKGDRRDSHEAIQHALDLLSHQPRDLAARVIIYITGGIATDADITLKVAERVRTKGILMFSVGVVQNANTEELGQIATRNTAQFVYSVNSLDGLSTISRSLGPRVCTAVRAAIQPQLPRAGS
uniref:VWACP-5 n=1 Tax=Colubraria reticulata TaxID=604273 RepID=A0AA96UUI6_9CAEN|nr:VWACP-5 [Colubraria reticulata]